jgi:hypothetical protein
MCVCGVALMQIVFHFEKRIDSEESCERRSASVRSDPSNESKNSVTLQILNCESSEPWFTSVDLRLMVSLKRVS